MTKGITTEKKTKRTTSRKSSKPSLRRPIDGTALAQNSGVILVQKGHGNKYIPRVIRRRLVSRAGCNNYGWIQHYLDHKKLLTELFGKKNNFIWMTKINFEEFSKKWDKIRENPNNPKIYI